MKRFNFFKYISLANKVHTTYFNYWFFKHLTQGGEAPTEPVEGEGTEFTLSPTSNKKLAVVSLKGDTSQNTLTGKNLIPVDKYNANESRFTNFRINLPVNTYTISFDLDAFELGTATGFNVNMQLRYSDDTTYDPVIISINSSTSLGRKTFTFTTTKVVDATGSQPSNIRIAQSSYDVGARVVFSNIQLEAGSTPTSYEPYCGGIPSPNPDYPQDVNVVTGTQTLTITNGTDEQTYPITLGSIELCKIGTYQDYIYKSGDKWLIHKENSKVTFTGNETWYQANTNAYYYVSVPDSLLLPSSGSTPPVYCYYYSPANRNELWGKQVDYGVGLYDGATARISIRNKDCADVTAFKTWLSSHNTTVYYALATPTDTEITDSTLLSNLNTLLTDGYLKKGTNTIKTTATGTNLPTIIYIKTN